MGSILKRFREPIFVVALLAVPFVVFFVKAKQGRDLSTLDRVVITLTAPVEKTITLAAFAAIDAWQGYAALRGVREENLTLRRETLKAHAVEQQ
ncbi:MAG TPA: rod shape-determining protein MreC, partial [Myxococcales bacterium]|nr:rod shape-determining protein MreC [Myxococcales bacterium]